MFRTSPLPAKTRPGRINEHQPACALGKPADGLSRGEWLPNAAPSSVNLNIAGMPPVITRNDCSGRVTHALDVAPDIVLRVNGP